MKDNYDIAYYLIIGPRLNRTVCDIVVQPLYIPAEQFILSISEHLQFITTKANLKHFPWGNCNGNPQKFEDEINEIFEITGFSEIMKVEKAIRELSLEGAEVIGQGGHGKVLRINGDTIVKLFHPSTTLEEVRREQDYAKKAFVLGLPTAIPFDVVKCDDCYGLVFELINSTTLSDFLNKNPEKFEEYAVKYANLLKQLHATKISEGMLSGTKELYRDRINSLGELGYFTDKEIEDLHRINNAFADDISVIHGDFHAKNVMVMDGELVLIDMADITYGNPLYDLGSMMLTHVTVSGERKVDINGMPAESVDRLWQIFISVYLGTTDANVIGLAMKKAGIFAVLKAATALSFSPGANQEYIINHITNMVRENILSNADGCVQLLSM
jgi:uncharacterized protein (TIGR02172 family)